MRIGWQSVSGGNAHRAATRIGWHWWLAHQCFDGATMLSFLIGCHWLCQCSFLSELLPMHWHSQWHKAKRNEPAGDH